VPNETACDDVVQPIPACCELTASRLSTVDNVWERFPWLQAWRGGSGYYRDQPGFGFALGGQRIVVSSWLFVWNHPVRRHGPRAWEDFLHAASRPCLVIEDTSQRWRRPRYALYRLRDGLEDTFRVAVIEDHGDGQFVLVTAMPKKSLTNKHYGSLKEQRLPERCPAFCLRTRDLDPAARPRIDRPAPCLSEVPFDDCCENRLACLNSGREPAEGMA